MAKTDNIETTKDLSQSSGRAPDLEKIRADMEAKHRELLALLGEEEDELRVGPGENPDRSSLAQRYADRQLNLAFHDKTLEQLEQVERALMKLDSEKETYGECENCGEMIAAARLAALPHAPLCVECQAERDKRG
jgi:DnaK suppressor protein